MKKILIALALLAPLPAAADTIYVALNPNSLSMEYPQFYQDLLWSGFYGSYPGCVFCGYEYPTPLRISVAFADFESSFPGVSPDSFVFGWAAAVPEPATWLLLLIGFAFFALKGIWPTRVKP